MGVAMSALSLILSGCFSSGPRGITEQEATENAEAIVGVLSAEVTNETVRTAPFKTEHRTEVKLTLDPDFELERPTDWLRWALEAAWSVGSDRPEYSVRVGMSYPDGTHPEVDWATVFTELDVDAGPPDFRADRIYGETGSLGFSSDAVEDVLDTPWPGEPPATPEGLFATRAE